MTTRLYLPLKPYVPSPPRPTVARPPSHSSAPTTVIHAPTTVIQHYPPGYRPRIPIGSVYPHYYHPWYRPVWYWPTYHNYANGSIGVLQWLVMLLVLVAVAGLVVYSVQRVK